MTTMAGIRPDQGPPLSVPLSFFLVAPLALLVAGALAIVRASGGFSSALAPGAVALVHLATVGLLLPVMLGALYQMLPVVAGAVIPRPRVAHVVHALLVAGGVALVHGQATGEPRSFALAWPLVGLAVTIFLAPAAWALARTEVRTPTAAGLGVGLAALAVVALAGVRLAAVRGGLGDALGLGLGAGLHTQWPTLRTAHALVGLLGWVGGLIAAVSWQVLPMFFFAPAPGPRVTRAVLASLALSVVALALASFVALPVPVWALALPGALAVWAIEPAWALSALRARKRKRRDATLWFWWLGLGAAPLCLALGAAAVALDEPRVTLALGLVVLWGWSGAIVHGMLLRIVPFLVWLHWCAPRIGQADVPSAKELLPDREVSLGFGLHALTLALGLAAVASGHSLAWTVFGAGLAATGCWLLAAIVVTLRRGRVPASTPEPT
jgi:hypothetical protein